MKKHFHLHFYIRIFFLGILVSALFFVAYQKVAQADMNEGKYPFAGWAWSPNIGWLSLNCLNDFNGDGVITNNDPIDDTCSAASGGSGFVDYGLSLDVTNSSDRRAVVGCAWAGNIGWWICFNDPGSTQAPAKGVFLNGPTGELYYQPNTFILDPDNVLVENSLCHDEDALCHASILPLEGETDWTWELGFPLGPIESGSGVLDSCFNCQTGTSKFCSISGAPCTMDDQCFPGGGTCSVTVENNICDNCLKYTYDGDGNLTSTQAGYQCSDCALNSPDARCPDNAYNDNQNTCQTCDTYYGTPGLMVDYASSTNDGRGYMCGWAWNKEASSGYGIGWLQFSPRITAGNNPYFQVDSGNIYSRANIRANYMLPPNKYNAYIIEAGGTIENFYASSTRPNLQDGIGLPALQNRSLISFPSLTSTGYLKNILGKIDYDGLITEIGETGKNKYGSEIKRYSGSDTDWSKIIQGGTLGLGGKTFYNPNANFIAGSSGLTLASNSSGKDASGIVIMNGSAILSNNIKYDTATPNKLSEIASVVWIIKGDLYIDPGVTEIAGTFILLGADGSNCNVSESDCGRFISSESPGSNQLVINGSVLAKKFVLNRTYATNGEPAEKFVNDGRLQVNPPKGMQNFAQSLPKLNYNPY